MIKAVIDTNIFFSAFYLPVSKPAEVVLKARENEIVNCISAEILEEISRILMERLFWDERRTKKAVNNIKKFSKVVSSSSRLKVIVDDPDNRILECAVAGKADFIVTGDKHLLKLKKFRRIVILTPADFLKAVEK